MKSSSRKAPQLTDKETKADDSDPQAFNQIAQGRWLPVLRFLEEWGREIKPGDGVPLSEIEEAEHILSFPLPAALREWLLISGIRSSDQRDNTQFLRLPGQLKVYDGFLIFYDENQGTVSWGIRVSDLANDDPPVFIDASDVNVGGLGWVLENDSLSQFISQMEVTDTITFAKFYASARISPEVADGIKSLIPSLGLPAWHWPVFPTTLYGDSDLLAEVDGTRALALAARTEIDLRRGLKLLSSVHMSIVKYGPCCGWASPKK